MTKNSLRSWGCFSFLMASVSLFPFPSQLWADLASPDFNLLPPCENSAGDGKIDLQKRCVEGICLDHKYSQITRTLGNPQKCTPDSGGVVACEWRNGISVIVPEGQSEGRPDVNETPLLIEVSHPYPGTGSGGEGIGKSLQCLVKSLGEPNSLSQLRLGNVWYITEMLFKDLGVSVTDETKADNEKPDGLVDRITFSEP